MQERFDSAQGQASTYPKNSHTTHMPNLVEGVNMCGGLNGYLARNSVDLSQLVVYLNLEQVSETH